MKTTSKLIAIFAAVTMFQGCSMMNEPYSSNSASYHDNTYSENYNDNMYNSSDQNQVRSNSYNDDKPIQMTPQDRQLQAVSPEMKAIVPTNANKTEKKKVYLPISSSIE